MTMESKSRTNTMDSLPPSQQEAAASLDPLAQSIHDHDDSPVYLRRQSSIFYIPASSIHGQDENQLHGIRKYFAFMRRFSGIFYALLGSFLATVSNFTLKQLNVNILDVLLVRCTVHSIISLCFILYKGYHFIPDNHRVLILIRSLCAASGTIAFFYCLTLLPLPDLTTLRYTQVVWTAVIAMIIFRERIAFPTIFACLLTLIGVICVAQPTFLFPRSKPVNGTFSKTEKAFNDQQFLGMIIAIGCAIAVSLSIVLNKVLTQKKVLQSLIMFYFLITSFLLLLFIRMYAWIFSEWKSQFLTKDFLLASIIIISQLIPMICSQKAIKREHPSIISVAQSSDIIIALILQNVFTSSKTNPLALIGSMLVITSIFIVGGYKLWLDRQHRTCLPMPIENKS